MEQLMNNAYFWQKIDSLLFSLSYRKVRIQGDPHPLYPNLIYPMEYGYMIDWDDDQRIATRVFKGSHPSKVCDAVIICCDILAKDMSIKLLIGCTEEEKMAALKFLNQTSFQKTILVRRTYDTPSWAFDDDTI